MSNLPAVIDDDLMVGLEDLDDSDKITPRIDIVTKEGKFKDAQSGERFDELDCIALGIVKSRVLFDADLDNNQVLCRSINHEDGRPFVKEFPWKASGFNEADYPIDSPLPCDSCALKEFGSHPTRKNSTYCAEQWTFIVLRGEAMSPALFTVQRTGIKPARAYVGSYSNQRQPLFVARTRIKLDLLKKGDNPYSVPTFECYGETDQSLWPQFANKYRALRAFLTTPRTEEPEATPVSVTPAASAPEPAAPAAAGPAASPAGDADDLF